jgi:hypothetical protein
MARARGQLDSFREAAPPLADREAFHAAVINVLRSRPNLVEQWSWYSEDKRTTPSPYLLPIRNPHAPTRYEVGVVDAAGHHDVIEYTDAALACADFLYREATSVLRPQP